MSAPRVSVVIPTYNRASFVVQAVQSVLAQTYGDFEVIVADDGSDDGSLELVAAVGDERVDVLTLDHSGIPAVARNAALAKARGDLVAFLDSDDIWYPEKLERQVDVFDGNSSVGLVCSNARVIDGGGEESRQLYLRPEQGASGDVLEQLLDVNFVIVSSAIVRRVLVDSAGRFGEDPLLRTVEDYDLWLRVGAVAEVVYLAEPLVGYREHGGSVRADVPRVTHWTALLVALGNLERFLDGDDRRRETLLPPQRAALLVELARAQRTEVGAVAALRSLWGATRANPATVAARVLRDPADSALRGAGRVVRRAVRKAPALG